MIKIACIGDSLTYGYLLENRTTTCYPATLNELLGEDYAVGNFGVNGTTLLKSSSQSFWHHENFTLSTLFDPDIVIIMLGTNDASHENFTTTDHYLADYKEMINHYRNLPAKPHIYMATPPAVFPPKDPSMSTLPTAHIDLLASSVRELGKQLRISVIDINKLTSNAPQLFIADGIHMNQSGAKFIATAMYRELSKK